MKSALVVDDDLAMLNLLGVWLEQQGYQITSLSDFHDANELLRTRQFTLLVTDVRLGGFNGLQLAIAARQADPDVRIIVISGWDDVTLSREAKACGATVLSKPFNEKALLAALANGRG